MNYIFKVPIGDWSDDGHGKCDMYKLGCNHTVEEVRQAYKDSCKLTGIQFNHNQDYTEGIIKKGEYGTWKMIATDYEDSTVKKETMDVLKANNIDFSFVLADEEEEEYQIEGSEDFLELLMAFIKLSLLDLEWEILRDDDIPYLNGYWNKDLNVQFGYGLFE